MRGQQIYELILGPHLCWEDFFRTEGILYGVCRSEKLAAEAALLPARGSRFSGSPNVCRQLKSEQHLCQETINVTLLHISHIAILNFRVGPVVTLIW